MFFVLRSNLGMQYTQWLANLGNANLGSACGLGLLMVLLFYFLNVYREYSAYILNCMM